MDRILIVGQHTLIRAKLNSILIRSNIVEVFDTFSEAYSAVEKKHMIKQSWMDYPMAFEL